MRTTRTIALAGLIVAAAVLTACAGESTNNDSDVPSIPAQQWTPGTPP
ncbi:hypothetical protein HQO87_25850, partial [Rhodococcus fascians]|nr:hypothetical protein [Rhodococcus fascians]